MSLPYTWDHVWNTFTNTLWYKWTVFRDSGGDASTWIDNTIPNTPRRCKALIRRSDGLIFQQTLSCHECDNEYANRYPGRGKQIGYYFRGTDVFRTTYNEYGRQLPEPRSSRMK